MIARASLVAVLLSTAVLAAERPTPIAVMPFKNLNSDPSLSWLTVGIAETMLSDLKRIAKVPVVERDQIDKAITEMSVQAMKGTEESTAAKIGKLVGAKTIVLGGIQQAGKQLRITARFVNVETGEVLDTAKATGPVENVFQLQDEIVAKLIGVEPTKVHAVARKGTAKTVKAYKLYAAALTTASDADRLLYLRQAVDEDPDFTYAVADLARLEERMKQYGKANAEATQERLESTSTQLNDPSLDNEKKAALATRLLSTLATNQRWKQLRIEAERIEKMEIADTGYMSVREYAGYYSFLSAYQLKDYDSTLKLGEKFLKAYPGGQFYGSVEMMMRTVIDQRRDIEEKKGELEKKYAEMDAELAKDEEDAKKRKRELPQIRYMSHEFRRCSEASSMRQYERTISECQKYLDKWTGREVEPSLDDTAKQFLFQAKWMQALAHNELGHLQEAKKRYEQLVAEDPQRARQFGVTTYLSLIPKD